MHLKYLSREKSKDRLLYGDHLYICISMQTYLTFGQAERVAEVQSPIHVRVGEGDKVLVFAVRKKTKQFKVVEKV